MTTGTAGSFSRTLVFMVFLLVAVLVGLVILLTGDLDEAWEEVWRHPWNLVFAAAALIAFLVQGAVSYSFRHKGLYEETTILPQGVPGAGSSEARRFLGELLETFLVPLIGGYLLLGSVVHVASFTLHIGLAVGFFALYATLDAVYVKWVQPRHVGNKTHKAAAARLRGYCRQLLWHVDGLSLGIVAVWACLLWLGGELGPWEWSYMPSNGSPEQLSLVRPMMAGVIGFQMIASLWLLLAHLWAWERGLMTEK